MFVKQYVYIIGVGGRERLHGLRFFPLEQGAAWDDLSSVRPFVRSYVRKSRLAKDQWNRWFAQGFGLEEVKKGFVFGVGISTPNGANFGHFTPFGDFFHETLPFLLSKDD